MWVMSLFMFVVILYDAHLLQRKMRSLYKSTFLVPPVIWAIAGGLLLILVVPIYLYQRLKFFEDIRNAVDELDEQQEYERWGRGKWMFADCLGLIMAWIIAVFWLGFIIDWLGPRIPVLKSELMRISLGSVLESLLMLGLIYRVSQHYRPGGFSRMVGLKNSQEPVHKRVLVPAILGAIFAVASALITIMRDVQPQTPLSEMLESATSSNALLVFIFMAIFLAPLVEELIFRGYFYGVLREYKGKVVAFVAIALLFSGLHFYQYWGDWMALVMVTLLGFGLTWIRVWAQTTQASIVMHYVYNTLLIFIPVVYLLATNPAYVQYEAMYDQLTPTQKEELLLESIRVRPEFAPAYNDLAWLYYEEDRSLEKALELVDVAIAHAENPQDKNLFLETKADILWRLGDKAEALEIQEQLVLANPQDEEMRQKIKEWQSDMDLE